MVKKLMLIAFIIGTLGWVQPGAQCDINVDPSPQNRYYRPTNSQTIVPGDTTIQLANTSGLAPNDVVIVIQMQGALIHVPSSNTDMNYGANNGTGSGYLTTGSTFLAGNWEYAHVSTVTSSSISLHSGVSKAYHQNNAGAYKFQVVRVSVTSNYTMASDFTGASWNGLTGGVTAVLDLGTLNLNGKSIHSNTLGFRRPSWPSGNSSLQTMLYTGNGSYGGRKGEGISGGPAALSNSAGYSAGDYARGAPGNAGGGGNGHNAGGGGGGNGGAGGLGGEDYRNGSSQVSGGIGGAEFAQAGAQRIVMGGSGGTGHQNNSLTRYPGKGGGITIVQASSLTGSGTIDAIGGNADHNVGGMNDGGSGGGAGGTVVIYSDGPSTASISSDVSGGYGGNASNLHGGGGGGAGGVVLSNIPVTSDVSGGAYGIAGSYGAYGATVGEDGIVGSSVGIPLLECTLPVELASVQLKQKGAFVKAVWHTASAYDHAGFQWYGIDAKGERESVGGFIAARSVSSTKRQSYKTKLTSQGGYTEYALASISTTGQETFYGPYKVDERYGRDTQVGSIDWEHIRHQLTDKNFERFGAAYVPKSELVSKDKILRYRRSLKKSLKRQQWRERKFGVVQLQVEGPFPQLFSVSAQELAMAGWDVARIHPQEIAVTLSGKKLPRRVVRAQSEKILGSDAEIIFGITEVPERFASYQKGAIVELSLTPKLVEEMKHRQPSLGNEGTLAKRVRVTEPKLYDFTLSGDPWVAQRILRRARAKSVRYTVASDSDAPISLTLALNGSSDWPDIENEHSIVFTWNGQEVGQVVFSGQEQLEYTLHLDQVIPGDNELKVSLLKATDKPFDMITISEINYQQELKTVSQAELLGQLCWGTGKSFHIPWAAEERFGVFAVDQGQWVSLESYEYGGKLRFGGLGPETAYYVGAPHKVLDVRSLSKLEKPKAGGANYLILAHDAFLHHPKMAEFIDHKQAQGFKVKAVSVQELFDIYGGGNIDPLALKKYLKQARRAQYVLLVGSDTYDTLNRVSDSISFIPTVYREMNGIGQSLFDQFYVDFDDDGRGDIALGRWPVRQDDELAMIVDKTINFSNRIHNEGSIVTLEPGYEHHASKILNLLGDQAATVLETESTLSERDKASSLRSQLLELWSQGAEQVVYLGHGSPSQWGQKTILHHSDIEESLEGSNGASLVSVLGCYSTYFVQPTENTLAHKLLFGSQSQGAVLLQGGSTLASASDNLNIYTKQMRKRKQLKRRQKSLGKAFVKGSKKMPATAVGNWHILGDPSL